MPSDVDALPLVLVMASEPLLFNNDCDSDDTNIEEANDDDDNNLDSVNDDSRDTQGNEEQYGEE
jgi:hypothetical protein